MAQDIQQNYKAVSGSPPSTGINPGILTAPHYEVQWPPKRWVRLWARKHWVMKHIIIIIIGVRMQAASTAPPVAPCCSLSSRQHTGYLLQLAKLHTLLLAPGVSAARSWRWDGNKPVSAACTCLCSLFCTGDARLPLRRDKPRANRFSQGCHTATWTLDVTLLSSSKGLSLRASQSPPMKPSYSSRLHLKPRTGHVQDGQAPWAATPGRGDWTQSMGAVLGNVSLVLSPLKQETASHVSPAAASNWGASKSSSVFSRGTECAEMLCCLWLLVGFFHQGLPLLLNLPQLPQTYCCMERETTWNKVSLRSNFKRKGKVLRLMQKSIAREHHRRETLTQALEQAFFKWPVIPSQQKQCFHLHLASKLTTFLGTVIHLWWMCSLYLPSLFLLPSPACYSVYYPPHLRHEQITKHHQAVCKHCASSEQFWQLRNNYSVNMNCTLSKAGRQISRW